MLGFADLFYFCLKLRNVFDAVTSVVIANTVQLSVSSISPFIIDQVQERYLNAHLKQPISKNWLKVCNYYSDIVSLTILMSLTKLGR